MTPCFYPDVLRHWRMAQGDTTGRVLAVAGLDQATVRRVEGGRTIPNARTLKKLALYYPADILPLIAWPTAKTSLRARQCPQERVRALARAGMVACHPDRWQQHPCAVEASQRFSQLRASV